jgi:hypothetical protein
MLSREDFMFTIGYDGPVAVVDGQAKKKYGSLTTGELARAGLFRAAYCSALRSKKPEEMDELVAAYNASAGTSYTRDNPFSRLLGVIEVDAKRCVVL